MFNTVYHDTRETVIFSETIIIPPESHTVTTLRRSGGHPTLTATSAFIHSQQVFTSTSNRRRFRRASHASTSFQRQARDKQAQTRSCAHSACSCTHKCSSARCSLYHFISGGKSTEKNILK